MTKPLDPKGRHEHLLRVVTSQRFLKKEGLGNEVPFFICPFPPDQALTMDQDRRSLIRQIEQTGVRVLAIDLYDLALDLLRERDLLERLLEVEVETDKGELKELMQSVLDPETHLIPKIAEAIDATPHDVIFLSGVGEVFPYIRSHTVLNNLQSTAKDRPTLLFFPGDYTHSFATGASLDLFGRLQDDKYYRAFNILNYEV